MSDNIGCGTLFAVFFCCFICFMLGAVANQQGQPVPEEPQAFTQGEKPGTEPQAFARGWASGYWAAHGVAATDCKPPFSEVRQQFEAGEDVSSLCQFTALDGGDLPIRFWPAAERYFHELGVKIDCADGMSPSRLMQAHKQKFSIAGWCYYTPVNEGGSLPPGFVNLAEAPAG